MACIPFSFWDTALVQFSFRRTNTGWGLDESGIRDLSIIRNIRSNRTTYRAYSIGVKWTDINTIDVYVKTAEQFNGNANIHILDYSCGLANSMLTFKGTVSDLTDNDMDTIYTLDNSYIGVKGLSDYDQTGSGLYSYSYRANGTKTKYRITVKNGYSDLTILVLDRYISAIISIGVSSTKQINYTSKQILWYNERYLPSQTDLDNYLTLTVSQDLSYVDALINTSYSSTSFLINSYSNVTIQQLPASAE